MISTLIGCQQFKKKSFTLNRDGAIISFSIWLPPSLTHTHTHTLTHKKIIKHMLPKKNVIAQNVLFHSSGKLVSSQLC